MIRFLVAALALAAPLPAVAQPAATTDIAVAADAAWRHEPSGLNLPATIAGLPRVTLTRIEGAETDIVATYSSRTEGVIALVYLTRTQVPDAALWFDRALASIMAEQAGAPPPAVAGFTRPGASVASGLRMAMDDRANGMRSTTLATTAIGPWLIKVRLGSNRLTPAELDARMTAFVADLGWPAEAPGARAAAEIRPCPAPLRLRPARVLPQDMTNALIDSVAGSTRPGEDPARPPLYCREAGATAEIGVYRPGGSNDVYLIAIGQEGSAITVGPAIDVGALLGNGASRRRYSVTLLGTASTTPYGSFDRLPPPEQAMQLVRTTRPSISTAVAE